MHCISGICLPLIGHVYKFDSKTAQDPVGGLWRLYKKYQKDGMLHMNTFGLNIVFIGDFKTLKYVYNHPDVQDRLTGIGLEGPVREEKRVKGKAIPGIFSYRLCKTKHSTLIKWSFCVIPIFIYPFYTHKYQNRCKLCKTKITTCLRCYFK